MYSDIDHGMFVLNVDLWSADGFREVNLVRHSATSPSISSTTPVSYAEVQAASSAAYSQILPSSGHFKVEPGQGHPGAPYNPYPGPPQVNPYAQPPGGQSYGGAPQYHQGYAPTTNGGVYPHKMVTARDNLSQSTTRLEQGSTPLELVGKHLEWTTRQVTAKSLPTVVLTLLLTSTCHGCQSIALHHRECSPAT